MSDAMPPDGSAAQDLRLPRGGFDDLPGLQGEDGELLRGAGGEPAPGSSGDEESILHRAGALRFPDLRELHGRARIDALVDHITATAIARGELEELRLQAHVNLRDAELALARVPSSVTRSRAAIDEAKRQARPDLGQAIDGARWLVTRCSEQIARLGGSDYDAASRAYTLLSGV